VYAALERERAELQALARLDREDRLLADRVKVLKRELRFQEDPFNAFSRAWSRRVSPYLALTQGAGLAVMLSGLLVLCTSLRFDLLLLGLASLIFNLLVLPGLFRRGVA